MIKNLTMLALGFVLVGAAHAGKLEREFKKSDLDPAITATSEATKKFCGCEIKVSADKSIVSIEEMRLVMNLGKSIADGVEKYCTDDESKKAVCKLKTVSLEKGKDTAFSFSGSAGKGVTDGHSFPSFDMMMAQVDK